MWSFTTRWGHGLSSAGHEQRAVGGRTKFIGALAGRSAVPPIPLTAPDGGMVWTVLLPLLPPWVLTTFGAVRTRCSRSMTTSSTEWYRPGAAELRGMNAELREHIELGGVALRPLTTAGTAALAEAGP